MADLFTLFDGGLDAGGGAGVSKQTASSFSDVDSENEVVSTLASGTDSIDLLIDYSDFSNFVTFNSAESYVTITADQILNEYPIGGTVNDVQLFVNSLDGYQRYFLNRWPSRTGHLRFNPAVSSSYVRIDDFGTQDGVARTSFLSPGTGSISIQGWLDVPTLTGSDDVQVVFQKQQVGATNGYTVFVSGSQLYFQIVSGSTTVLTSGALASQPTFFAAVLDRTSATGSACVYLGTTGSYPTLRDSASATLGARFDLASGSFYMGSGSVGGKVVVPFTGSMDTLSVWSSARTLVDLSGTYNRKIHAQEHMIGLWRFNDATANTPSTFGSIVRDNSGHRLDGRIQQFFPAMLGSGSYVGDSPDPILSLDDPDVVEYVVEAQVSGALYDRNNQSIIFELFPEAFSKTADPTSAEVFRNFALILARHFDRIKTYVSQLANLRRVSYDEFDQAPDELLDEVGRFFGWNLQGSFATTDALRYFIGRSIQDGPAGNIGLDTKLTDIKAAFWRRTLQNLMYMYKTKGTRESVEALLRSYGANNSFIRLKEYARKTEATLPVSRVNAEKSVYALRFLSGASVSYTSNPLITSNTDYSLELRVKFPSGDNEDLAPTQLSGALLTIRSGNLGPYSLSLWYEKEAASAATGNLYLTSSAGRLQLTSASIFNDDFYNVAIVRERTTGSLRLYAARYDADELVYSTSSLALTASVGFPLNSDYFTVELGSSANSHSTGQFWAQEFRLWTAPLQADEFLAHAAHFESYGRGRSYDNDDLLIHWRLADGVAPVGGQITVVDSTVGAKSGTGSGFVDGQNAFTKFLESYAYIPGIDYGWNQEKVRTYDSTVIDRREAYEDERFVSLEFNLYDALNEDISHLMTSYDELGNMLGLPINKYREDYEGLQQMRETYFKRLQGKLNFRVFVDMLDFFDSSFVSIVERLLPARSLFKGDEMIVESHMLERPKYQYQLRPIREGLFDISGSIAITDFGDDFD